MFASRTLIDAERNYSPTEGEALAILFGLKRFESVLHGEKVIVRTDHRPLSFVKAGSDHNRKLARWWSEMQMFDLEIEYVPGKLNVVPDCLSRMTTNNEEVDINSTLGYQSFVSTDEYHWLDRVCDQCRDVLDDDVLRCDKCANQFHRGCCDGTDEGLPFWYCGRCVNTLDERDAS